MPAFASRLKLVLLMALIVTGTGGCSRAAASMGWYDESTRDVDALDYFTAEEIATGKIYRAQRRAFWFGGIVLDLIFWGALFCFGLARRIDVFSGRISGQRFWLRCAIFLAVVFAIRVVVFHPLAFASYAHRAANGLSNQSGLDWHADRARFLAGYLGLFALAVFAVYQIARWTPKWWWAWSGLGGAVLIVVGMYVYPNVIAPMFNTFTPLENGSLKTRLIELANRCDIDVDSIYVMDASRRSSHTNAYFAGIGGSRRIVLYDTLLEGHTDDEVASILAHEIGHWRHGHTARGVGWAIGGTFALLFFLDRVLVFVVGRRIGGIESKASLVGMPLVLLAMSCANLVSTPAQSAISRAMERQADDEELRLTGDPDLLISAMRKMAIANRSDVEPHPFVEWCFYSHPSTMNRIRRAVFEKRSLERMSSAVEP